MCLYRIRIAIADIPGSLIAFPVILFAGVVTLIAPLHADNGFNHSLPFFSQQSGGDGRLIIPYGCPAVYQAAMAGL